MLIYCVFGIILFDTMNSSLSLPQFELSQYVAEVMSQNAGHAAQRCSSRPPDTWPISVKVRICWNIGQFVYCCIHFSADYIYIYISSLNHLKTHPESSPKHLLILFFYLNQSSLTSIWFGFFFRGMAAVNMIHHMSLSTGRSVKSPLVIRMQSITWILKCTHQHTFISFSHLKLFHVILTMEGRFGKFVQLGCVLRLALPWKETRFSRWEGIRRMNSLQGMNLKVI